MKWSYSEITAILIS